jgi:hypothetical protein
MDATEIRTLDNETTDSQLLTLVNLSQKELIETDFEQHGIGPKRINRGFSARRYLSNWTRHWDEKLLDNLIKKGKLNEDTIYETKSNRPKRKRLNDDLSAIPPVYRINRNWLHSTGDLDGYKFFKGTDHNSETFFCGKLQPKTTMRPLWFFENCVKSGLFSTKLVTVDNPDSVRFLTEAK